MRSSIETTNLHRDALGRRSRFKRCSAGKRLIPTKRDLEILQWLYRYRFLRQTHLIAIISPKSQKRFVERLGDLFHETGYINRLDIQHRQFGAYSTPMLYEISNSGLAYLKAHSAIPDRAVTFSRRPRGAYNPQFLHTMMIIDTLVSIELENRPIADQRFVPVDEILRKAPQKTQDASNPLSIPVTLLPKSKYPFIRNRIDTHVIPDALYGIEYRIDCESRFRFWALECERTSPAKRSTANASSTMLKRAAYEALIESRQFKLHWGIPNFKLHLIATDGASRNSS
jgi:hypothetical protein